MYIDKLDEIIKYHRTIKIKPGGINPRIYFDFNLVNGDKNSNLKIDDIVTISKNVRRWSEADFMIKKAKITARWTYSISDLKGE